MDRLKKKLDNYSKFNSGSVITLDNIRKYCELSNNIQDKSKSVHIAGTNGKGSVSVIIASILGQVHKNVGLSISPHLSYINERLIINGKPISDNLLLEALEEVESIIKANKIELSFFEMMVAVAFQVFSELDYGVYEVGLGGRLDATNLLSKPKVSILTSIGLDHQRFLGDTLAEITKEKIGIMRADSSFVCGNVNESCFQIIQDKAIQLNTKVYSYGRDFNSYREGEELIYEDNLGSKFSISPSLRGEHQDINSAVAVKSALVLGVSKEKIKQGVSQAFMPARLESLKFGTRDLILDCAHNGSAFKYLVNYLEGQHIDNIDFIFTSLESKPWKEMINLIKSHIVNWYIVEVDSPRKESSENIANYIRELGEENVTSLGRNWGQEFDRMCGEETDRKILVAGSMYFVGELRAKIVKEEKPFW